MAKKTVGVMVTLCILLGLASVSLALEIEGKVAVIYNDIFLFETGEVLLAVGDASAANFNYLGEIKKGDYLKVSYGFEVAGVKIAEGIILDTGIELSDPSMEIQTFELFRTIEKKKDYILIDLRTKERYEAGHIPTSVSVPASGFNIKKLPSQKERLIVFYSENMRDASLKESADKAVNSGYTNVKVYLGGLDKWIKDGYYTVASLSHIKKLIEEEGKRLVFVDTRPYERAVAGHVPGAINIQFGWLNYKDIIQRDKSAYPIVFYGEDESDRSAFRTAVIASNWGYALKSNAPVKVLEGGLKAWKAAGLEIEKGDVRKSVTDFPKPLEVIPFNEFKSMWGKKGEDKELLDVRSRVEAHVLPSPNAVHIPIEELPFRLSELPGGKEIITFCTFGYRAKIAYHILKNNGYKVRYLNRNLRIRPDGTLQ